MVSPAFPIIKPTLWPGTIISNIEPPAPVGALKFGPRGGPFPSLLMMRSTLDFASLFTKKIFYCIRRYIYGAIITND